MKKIAIIGSMISLLMAHTAFAESTALLINNSFKKLPITVEYDLCDESVYPDKCQTYSSTIPAPTATNISYIEVPLANDKMYVYVHKMTEIDAQGKTIAQSQVDGTSCEMYQGSDAIAFNEYGTSHIFCNSSSSQAIAIK